MFRSFTPIRHNPPANARRNNAAGNALIKENVSDVMSRNEVTLGLTESMLPGRRTLH
jgi:hypothetical protein